MNIGMAHEFIAAQRFAFSDLSEQYGELEDLFARRWVLL
jgi:hypothetical protein